LVADFLLRFRARDRGLRVPHFPFGITASCQLLGRWEINGEIVLLCGYGFWMWIWIHGIPSTWHMCFIFTSTWMPKGSSKQQPKGKTTEYHRIRREMRAATRAMRISAANAARSTAERAFHDGDLGLIRAKLALAEGDYTTVVHMALLAYGWERGDPRRIARMGELRARIEHLEGLLVAGELPGAEAGPIPPPSPPPAAAPRGLHLARGDCTSTSQRKE